MSSFRGHVASLALVAALVGGAVAPLVDGAGAARSSRSPILGQFGLLTGLSIFYSYLSSLVVLPSALAVWARLAA